MIQSYVSLKKDTHQYFDTDGRQYLSVSRLLERTGDKFDAQKISAICAGKGKYSGMNQAEVLKQWDMKRERASDHGTRIHDALERYSNYGQIDEDDVALTPMLQSVCSDYLGYKKNMSEVILYSPNMAALGTFIAGTTDKVLVTSTRNGLTDIEDYKTNLEKGIEFVNSANKFMKAPFDHLQDCNYIKYCLQLSCYGVMYEELTGQKVRQMWLRFIPAEDPLNHKRIPVPFLKFEAQMLFDLYHQEVHETKKNTFAEAIGEVEPDGPTF